MPSPVSGGWRLRTVTLAPALGSRCATGRPSVPVPPVTRIDVAMTSPFTGKTKRSWNKRCALHQPAVVNGEHGEPGLVEALCEQVGAGLLGDSEPASHDHAGTVSPRIVPGRALGAATGEDDFLPVHKHAAFDGTVHRGSFEGFTACETGRRRRVHRGPFRGSRPRRCRVSLRAGSARHP